MSIRTIEPLEELKLLAHLDIPHAVKDEFGLSTIDLDRSLLNWKRRRNIVAFLIMLDAGLRVGEVISLSISDCYACSHPVRTLTIRGPLSRKGSDRDIPVSPRLYRALEYLTPENLLIPDRPYTQKIISNKPQGPPLTTRSLERIIVAASLSAIGRSITPHVLRHTFATKLMRKTDIRTVQELLGHKHLGSTQIYTHPDMIDKRNAIDSLNTPPPNLSP